MATDLDRKKTHILVLLMLAEIDNVEHIFERKFINQVAGRLGLSIEDVDEVDKHPYKLTLELPVTPEERMTMMYDLLWLMKIDGNVVEEERAFINEIGLRLGFRQDMVGELITIIAQYIGKPVPDNALLDIIRKYSN